MRHPPHTRYPPRASSPPELHRLPPVAVRRVAHEAHPPVQLAQQRVKGVVALPRRMPAEALRHSAQLRCFGLHRRLWERAQKLDHLVGVLLQHLDGEFGPVQSLLEGQLPGVRNDDGDAALQDAVKDAQRPALHAALRRQAVARLRHLRQAAGAVAAAVLGVPEQHAPFGLQVAEQRRPQPPRALVFNAGQHPPEVKQVLALRGAEPLDQVELRRAVGVVHAHRWRHDDVLRGVEHRPLGVAPLQPGDEDGLFDAQHVVVAQHRGAALGREHKQVVAPLRGRPVREAGLHRVHRLREEIVEEVVRLGVVQAPVHLGLEEALRQDGHQVKVRQVAVGREGRAGRHQLRQQRLQARVPMPAGLLAPQVAVERGRHRVAVDVDAQ
mmetsp:Transcript_24098/g.60683  ORF Transcript_24098/g.60683 Transcript_24098/m.60683 type:complete len:382 (-) Transcript_24098:356-1501(-)